MFDKILIANRGEIACRIMRTCRRLGITTVGVYSEADRAARHVGSADEAYCIGPAPAAESYLRIAPIIAAARTSGAQAIHPGYGFLSENPDFAEACAEAGIVFIGPPPAAMRAMGSKAAAKTLMAQAGVTLVAGYHGDAQDFATLRDAAAHIGYPVLLKASSGGGGRGMRVVTAVADLADAIDSARNEAIASFGDGQLLVEKYLSAPRHIEIQVFADTHGNCVHLFERDCSVQRRHQKVIEESPAPFLAAAARAQMGEAAIAACRAVGYVGAGTVEFIVQDGAFFFMEMNTRLQVEHPVTEFVTGQDLVEWQLRVAAGQPLPRAQADLGITGHAIEARICAEDPAADFRPATGRISRWREPRRGRGLRIDAGGRAGDRVTPYYDSMLAKLIVHADSRATALHKMALALDDFEIAGIATNLGLLRRIIRSEAFIAGGVDTGFIGAHPDLLHEAGDIVPGAVLAAAALAARTARRACMPGEDANSPWSASDAWCLNLPGSETVQLRRGDCVSVVRFGRAADGCETIDIGGTQHAFSASWPRPDAVRLRLGATLSSFTVLSALPSVTVFQRGDPIAFELIDPLTPPAAQARRASAELRAPLPSRVIRVAVQAGDAVAQGAVLVVIEAMKMEMTLSAPVDGVIAAVAVQARDMVEEGTLLLRFVEPGG